MRPVRFVALSEDGHALVLADEVGRLLALPVDDRVATALRVERHAGGGQLPASPANDFAAASSLAPRDIQARIRAGESADDVARVAGVPVDRVLRYAGPVLQERAMLAQHARRTKLKNSEKGASLAEVVDTRLAQHGIDSEKISWDAYRRDDGTWRILARWPSGKATAQAIWELDKSRQIVTPHDDMAQYLCAERPTQILGQDPPAPQHVPGELSRGGHEPMRPAADTARRESRPGRGLGDPIRSGRDALLASLDRPLEGQTGGTRLNPPAAPSADPARQPARGGAAALLGSPGSAFDEETDGTKAIPDVPSLAVLRPRRTTVPAPAAGGPEQPGDKPRKRLPSWDDVLFGGAPARESS
ncbi:septation protein SepH [Planosporangium sp. 12N6]|uniref:septation protein SepH n=1 Tax=Planosporangium spinosum TaxID=3402278 RepID=UPI003CF5C93F